MHMVKIFLYGVLTGWVTLGFLFWRYRTWARTEIEKLKEATRLVMG